VKAPSILLQADDSMKNTANRISSVILSGGIVLYPSDTVYGLLCRADNRELLKRLSKIKGYTRQRPFILLVDGTVMVKTVADCSDPEVIGIMECRWPGKLTLVLPASEECPKWVCGDERTVAVRYPADELSNLVLGNCGMPLVSTSANSAGGDSYCDVKDIPGCIKDEVDLVVDAGVLPPSFPSTILCLLRSSGISMH